MTVLLIILHVLVCFFLIAVVLLQSGKGAEIGAAFGGSSQTLFGSRGAASFMSKMTTVAAVVFMITSLTLAVVTSKSGSVVKSVPATQQQATPPPTGPVQGVQGNTAVTVTPQKTEQPPQQTTPKPQQTPAK
ncbi:MAG: preprotein translocase subunit SecG [Nitrospirota bacterium]